MRRILEAAYVDGRPAQPYSGGGPEGLQWLTILVNHKGKHAIITVDGWNEVFPGDDPT